jgi:cytochrome c oxidase cbb3-type subunit IV
MDPVIAIRAGSTVVTLLIFIGIVWWAYGGSRKTRFETVAVAVLHDDDTPAAHEQKERTA